MCIKTKIPAEIRQNHVNKCGLSVSAVKSKDTGNLFAKSFNVTYMESFDKITSIE